MSLSIHVRSDDGAVVVALAGTADAAMLEPLVDPLIAALREGGVLVLDLDELRIVDPPGLRSLVVGVIDTARGGQLRIATRDASTLESLADAGIDHLVAVHRSVADALVGLTGGVTSRG